MLREQARKPKVHVVFDLDETLITGPEHWKRAAMAGVLVMARATNGLTIARPKYRAAFEEWKGSASAEKLRAELQAAMTPRKPNGEQADAQTEITLEEAFLFHVLQAEVYAKNPNDRKQFDHLVARVNPSLKRFEMESHGGGLCSCHAHKGTVRIRVNRARELALSATSAYRNMRELNIQQGILRAIPGAPEALSQALEEGLHVAIASMGDQDKQEWKAHRIVLSQVPGGEAIPVFTTERKLFGIWRLKAGMKTPWFFRGLKRKLGVKKGDLVIMVGDRHDQDITPARKAGFYTVHVPGRRDARFLQYPEKSPAHAFATNLPGAMERVMQRVREFRSEGK